MTLTAEDFLFTRLSNFSAIAVLVGDRIYPAVPEDVQYPFVSYFLTRDYVEQHHGSVASPSGRSGTEHPIFTVSVHAVNTTQRAEIAAAIKDALVSFSGVVGGITVQGVRYLGGADRFDEIKKICERYMDFEIWFNL